MPLPVSTSFLVGALALSNLRGTVLSILVYVLVGIACLNELLRLIVLRTAAPPAARQREYTIPGAPRTIPNPLIPPDYESEDAS